ncbi:ABC transporter ATP-binding protein [Mycoplasmopsis alligatoris]|uniref:ABC transporter, ATP-binding protein n=1 Tax=Mycoplasmopsis alligatoris A21JP2 TaxID=747682 RepID=D4XW03_9BACT|nr:ABC transporter ATP-binding protein [Mycoplasmopsis alligatoris]EFF41458.1 ABC transporter, ATP-binding protein [Mycoplasmopsis alligatoris A21JP2]
MKIYTEKKRSLFTNKNYIRYQREGLEEMLDNKDKKLLVTMRNVDISYGTGTKSFKAVRDLNLNIYQGEVLGLVGESGSGKSTTGKALVGLIPYSFGQIKLMDQTLPKKLSRGLKFGKKLEEYNKIVNFLVNKVQMIFQDPANSLNPHRNVKDIVSEGLENTKNAREIYIYNYDQETLKELMVLIKEHNSHDKHLHSFDEINHEIAIDDKTAFNVLYQTFFEHLQNENYSYLSEFLKTKLEQRLEIEKYTEKDCKEKLVVEMLKQVGLDESVLRRYPLEFSGGQQQRIGISRAVILRPLLLVADEPISALDVSIQAQVVNIFNELKEKYNLTILFIAHDLRMVEYISDRIAVMNKGTLLEVGSTEEIMQNPLHPYTKSLLEAVPSIESNKGSLIGYVYDPKMHDYSQEQPQWIKDNENHFVLATHAEYKNWKNNKY